MKVCLNILIFTFLLLTSNVVYACSCSGYPTVCEAFNSADAVFIGSVERVQNQTTGDDPGTVYHGPQVAYIQVEKVFKGIKETEVIFRTEGSSCDAVYEEGERWLFYAYYDKKNNSWRTHACDRSTGLERASDDLLYLYGLPASAKQTRISGTLIHYEDYPESGFTRVKNLVGAKVKVVGPKKSYEVYTNKDGVYEIYGLPPGNYAVVPEVPPGMKTRFPIYFGALDASDRKNLKVVLKAKSCAGVDFVYSADTSIAGQLFGVDGNAMPRVCLSLMPKEKDARGNWNFDCTDEQGRYKLDEIPPGEYFIVINDDGEISSDEPFPTAYYPGVFEKEKATIITITAGTHLEDYDIRIPSQETRRVLQGVLLYSDGRPVANEFVEFTAEEVRQGYDGKVHTSTDSQGRFSLPVLKGLKGWLRGFMYTYVGEFRDCPKLDKLINARGGSVPDIGTNPIKLEINTDMQDLQLVFPFPYCVKAERQ